jgi:hypothetical protein
MSKKSFLKVALVAITIFVWVGCAGGETTSQSMDPKALFENRCVKCHTLAKTYKNDSAEYWTATVRRMKSKLLSRITDEDARIITQYLIDTRTGAFKPENAEKK